jgi:hypothetical protein
VLTKITFSGEVYYEHGDRMKKKPKENSITLDIAMREASFEGKHLGLPGAVILSSWLTKSDAVLSKLNLSNNVMLSKEAGAALSRALATNSILTELDVSHQYVDLTHADSKDQWNRSDGPGFARALAEGLITVNRRSSSITSSSQQQPREHVSRSSITSSSQQQPREHVSRLTALNISHNKLVSESPDIRIENKLKKGAMVAHEGSQCVVTYASNRYYRVIRMHGINTLIKAIARNRELVNLDLSNNDLKEETKEEMAAACERTGIQLVL